MNRETTEVTVNETGLTAFAESGWPEWANCMRPPSFSDEVALGIVFLDSMSKHAPQVLRGDRDLLIETRDVAEIRENLSRLANNARAELTLADWLERLIVAGNSDGRWHITLPTPKVRLPKHPPSIVRSDMGLFADFQIFESSLNDRLLGEPLNADQLGYAALCSAVVWGGITTSDRALAFLNIEPSDIAEYGGRLRILLKVSEGHNLRDEFWYPDSLTAVLIARGGLSSLQTVVKQSANNFDRSIHSILTRAMKELSLPKWPHQKGLLFRAVQVAQVMRVPPYVRAFQAGLIRSHSLPTAVLRRICGWVQPFSSAGCTDDISKKVLVESLQELPGSTDATTSVKEQDQHKLFKRFARILRRSKTPDEHARLFVQNNAASCWPVTLLIFRWAIFRLTASASGPAIASSTADRYLLSIFRPLFGVIDQEDPLSLEIEDFEFWYENAADRIRKNGEKEFFWGRVQNFHQFLTSLGAPDIDFQDLDGFIGTNGGVVSGNIISEQEYSQFKQALTPQMADQVICPGSRALLAGILGFRCGLRRREVQMLHLHDIHPGRYPMLIVRASRLAALKSASAQRRIPLRGLMPDDELELLLQFHSMRSTQLASNPGLLFAHAHTPNTPLPAEHLFDPVTHLFQAITKNVGQIFRYHHLRHSFANWTLLALLAADNPELIDSCLPFLETPQLKPDRVKALRDVFFPQLPDVVGSVERRNLYLVSYLLGHLSPATTLKHYIHVVDWLAGQEMELALGRHLNSISAPQLGTLCGLSHTMPFKAPYREYSENPLSFLRCFVSGHVAQEIREIKSSDPHRADLSAIVQRVRQPGVPHPMVLIAALARRAMRPNSDLVYRSYGISKDAIEQAEKSYIKLYSKQSQYKNISESVRPATPRNRDDQVIFWRIIAATMAAFEDAGNREVLRETASALIRRIGPKSGNLYAGADDKRASRLLSGLELMGLQPDELAVELRFPVASTTFNNNFVEPDWIRTKTCRIMSTQSKRSGSSVLYVVSASTPISRECESTKGREGLIRGLNYSAIWLEFACSETR